LVPRAIAGKQRAVTIRRVAKIHTRELKPWWIVDVAFFDVRYAVAVDVAMVDLEFHEAERRQWTAIVVFAVGIGEIPLSHERDPPRQRAVECK
jgi:hypothetical protein